MATLRLISDEISGALGRPFDAMFKERIKSILRHEVSTIVRQAIDKGSLTDHFKTRFSTSISIVEDSSLPCGTTCGAIRSTNKLAQPIRYKTDDPFSFIGNKDGTVVYIYTKLTELPYADLTEAYQAKPIRYIYENGYLYFKFPNITTCGGIISITSYSSIVAGTLLVNSISHGLTTSDKVLIYNNSNKVDTYTITVVDANNYYIASVIDFPATKWILDLSNECVTVEGAYPLGDVFSDTKEARLNDKIFTDDTELPIPEDLIQSIKLKLLSGELSIIDDKDKIAASHIDN